MKVVIVGGGAIGVTTSCYLARRGVEVTLYEMNKLGHGASFGNAGLLVPSYSAPLASFGNLIEGMRSLLGAGSAINVRLSPNPETITWILRFIAASFPRATTRGLESLAALTKRSLKLYDQLLGSEPAAGVAYAKGGTMYVARDATTLADSAKLAERLSSIGIRSDVLSSARARATEPTLSSSIAGAIYYPDDARLQPLSFVNFMADLAKTLGVTIRNKRVDSITREGAFVTGVRTESDIVEADLVILAAGSWSPALAKSLGLRVPILPAKGYSLDLKLAHKPQNSILFLERHVSVTPMNGVIRATTGLDFHGLDATVMPQRLQLIRAAYREYLDAPDITEEGLPWAGFRPLTPDGLPIIGRSSRLGNLVYATGHGPLGVTLAPVTAELVTKIVFNEPVPTAVAVSPNRFHV